MQNQQDVIFLAGFPRSGTTWFSNLINSHQSVVYRHELIGRNYTAFGDELFSKIKFNNGINDQDFETAMKVIRSANVETDKPPFFKKSFGLSNYPTLHNYCWLLSKALPPLRPIYNTCFKVPKNQIGIKILLKETRSAKDMESLLNGLRVKHKIFLIRKPHGCIASHLKGIEQGKMAKIDLEYKQRWLNLYQSNQYVQELNLTRDKLKEITPLEVIAISWNIYHQDIINLLNRFQDTIVCFYEDYVENPVELTKKLMAKLSLEYSESVSNFIKQSTGMSEPGSLLSGKNNDYFSVYREKSFNAEAYKEQLTAEEIELVNRYTNTLYQRLKKKTG